MEGRKMKKMGIGYSLKGGVGGVFPRILLSCEFGVTERHCSQTYCGTCCARAQSSDFHVHI